MDLGEKFIIRSNSLDPKQGKILISEPLMNDFHFGRSVVLLIDHEESEGSFGIIINKKLEVQVNHIVDEFPDFEAPVYLGGPVAEDQLFFIHTLGEMIPESYPIVDGLYWGGDHETLATLIHTGIANEDNVRFYLGYSGWVQFPDGEIYIVNYIVDDAWDKGQIRGYSLTMDDFILFVD